MYPIRLCRAKNMQIWGLRLVESRNLFELVEKNMSLSLNKSVKHNTFCLDI